MKTRAAKLPQEIWVLVAASFVIALGFGLVAPPALPQFARSFDVSVTAATIVISSFAFMRLVFAPMSGTLVQKLGERPVYIVGLLIVAVSTGACAFAGGEYWQLLLFRSLGGIGSTMFTVSASADHSHVTVGQSRPRVGSVRDKLSHGIDRRPAGRRCAVAVRSADAVHHLRNCVGDRRARCLREPAWISFGVTGQGCRCEVDDSHRRPPVSGVPGSARIEPRLRWRDLRSSRCHGSPCSSSSSSAETPSIAAYALTIFAVGNALVLIVSGRLSDRFGRKPFVVSGLLICGLGTIAMGFTDNLVVFFAIAAVTGVGSAHESGPAGRGCRCCRIDGPRRTRSGGIPDDVRHRWG